MIRRTSIALIAVACVLTGSAAISRPVVVARGLFHLEPAAPPPNLAFGYRGWRVDARAAGRGVSPTKAVRTIKAQIDIVERVGLKPADLAFMRSQPVVADERVTPGEPFSYAPGGPVVLHLRRLDAKKPILLYGLLQAYQAQKLPGGYDNADVNRLREMAAARRIWPKTALMLQSNQDFFAFNAAAYLSGVITREPYSRGDLNKTEPECYRWMAALFDNGRART